jgi:hypothetical protein
LDVGKGEHHATAVTAGGKKAFDKRLPNSEPKLREVFGKLQAKHGTVLVVVDQPASIGALPLAVARDMGCPVAYQCAVLGVPKLCTSSRSLVNGSMSPEQCRHRGYPHPEDSPVSR